MKKTDIALILLLMISSAAVTWAVVSRLRDPAPEARQALVRFLVALEAGDAEGAGERLYVESGSADDDAMSAMLRVLAGDAAVRQAMEQQFGPSDETRPLPSATDAGEAEITSHDGQTAMFKFDDLFIPVRLKEGQWQVDLGQATPADVPDAESAERFRQAMAELADRIRAGDHATRQEANNAIAAIVVRETFDYLGDRATTRPSTEPVGQEP